MMLELALCRLSKKASLDSAEEPASPSAKPETPNTSEGHKKFGKHSSGKRRKEKQASPHSAQSETSHFHTNTSSDFQQV